MKKYKIILSVLSVIAFCSIALAFLAPGFFKNRVSGEPDGKTVDEFSLAGSKYTPMLTHSGTLDFPPLQTDIDNIFYTVNPTDGTVGFYEYSPAGLAPYNGTVNTIEKTVTCSNQDIPVTLYYIEAAGKITGFGLFTPAISQAPVNIYEYAFFKITALPSGYGTGGALLLIDFDKNNFWIKDKLFTDAFVIGLDSDNTKTRRLTTDNARTVDSSGGLRSDWIILTDDFLENVGGKAYFLSSRDYALDKKGQVSELLSIAEPKPPRVVTDMLGLWARVTENGIAYLRATQTGFDSILFADNKESVIKSFTGDYFKDYLSCGNYLFNKKSLVLTDLLTGTEKTLMNIQAGSAAFLSVSPDGAWAVIASPGTGETPAKAGQTLVFYSLATDAVKTVAEPLLFSQTNANFCWTDNNTLFHLRPAGDDGTGLGYCFIKMN